MNGWLKLTNWTGIKNIWKLCIILDIYANTILKISSHAMDSATWVFSYEYIFR